jgi:hypothetical protein
MTQAGSNALVTRFVVVVIIVAGPTLCAQGPPPRIGPIALDLHGTVPRFPEDAALASSRGISLGELPGAGFGVQVAAHLYFFRWRAVTFGIGGEAVAARAKHIPPSGATGVRPVTERFRTLGSQLSLNFGSGNGWSYLSGGIGSSNWSIIPGDRTALLADEEALKTINYGGGARWFFRSHLAFSFDVRFYALNPGSPSEGFPQSPRTTFMAIGAGISLKP